jgi:glucose-6-phosphate 1-dehydrogenase
VPIWNRRFIDSIQITVSKYIGVEGRGGYYVQPASLREIILNYQLADSPGTPTLIKKDTS